MTEPRDEIDTWLGREVEPLPPPAGTFDRIHHRARRRKLNQALTAVTGAVVVIAGAVLIPTVATGVLTGDNNSPPSHRAAASGGSHSVTAPCSVNLTSARLAGCDRRGGWRGAAACVADRETWSLSRTFSKLTCESACARAFLSASQA